MKVGTHSVILGLTLNLNSYYYKGYTDSKCFVLTLVIETIQGY